MGITIDEDSVLSSEVEVNQREYKERRDKSYDIQRPRYLEMTLDSILGMGMINNHVLVKVPRGDTEIIESSVDGFAMSVNTKFHQNEWAPTYVEVVSLPDGLRLAKAQDQRTDFDQFGVIEVEVGDRVLVRFLGITQALGLGDAKGDHRAVIDIGTGDLYCMVNYRDFIVRFRSKGVAIFEEGKKLYDKDDTDVFPLNGWVLFEPVEDEVMRESRMLAHLNNRESVKYGRVRYVGSKVEWYSEDFAPDTGDVAAGDLVVLHKGLKIQLQNDGNAVLGEKLYRTPIRHILSKMEVGGRPMTDQELFDMSNL